MGEVTSVSESDLSGWFVGEVTSVSEKDSVGEVEALKTENVNQSVAMLYFVDITCVGRVEP